MEQARLRRLALASAVILSVAAGVAYGVTRWPRKLSTAPPRTRAIAPSGVRVKVEVVNTTASRGLARRATFVLRDAGFDVVRFATDTTRRDTTIVIDRSGHINWARLVAKALGSGRVESRPDSSRYLDVTVFLGAHWRAPTQPFYP